MKRPRPHRVRFLVIGFAIAITSGLALFVNHLIQAESFKSQTILYLKQTTSDISTPVGANLIYQRFFGSPICQYTGREFVYAVNLSPEETRAYYTTYLDGKGWVFKIEMIGQDQSGEKVEWLLWAKSPSVTAPQELNFKLTATPQNHASVSFSHLPSKTWAKLPPTVGTVYSLSTIYHPNKEASAGCPSFKEQYIGWWEEEYP